MTNESTSLPSCAPVPHTALSAVAIGKRAARKAENMPPMKPITPETATPITANRKVTLMSKNQLRIGGTSRRADRASEE